MPKKRHYDTAPEEIKEKHKEKCREYMKEAMSGKYHLLFGDESLWGLITDIGKVWAKKGIRPVVEMCFKREWKSVIGFVEPLTGRFVSLIAGGLNKDWFEIALNYLRQCYGSSPIKLILDNAGWHTSKNLKVPEGINIEFQPPRSPETNPEEQLWGVLRKDTRSKTFIEMTALEQTLCKSLNALEDNPDKVRSITFQKWLHPVFQY